MDTALIIIALLYLGLSIWAISGLISRAGAPRTRRRGGPSAGLVEIDRQLHWGGVLSLPSGCR